MAPVLSLAKFLCDVLFLLWMVGTSHLGQQHMLLPLHLLVIL